MREYFAQHVREPAAQLGFLLTLSTSNNLLLAEAEAKQMALAGVQMIVVGVDSGVKADELNSLEVTIKL
ncbi:hypothetical protein DPMN_024352 [Dreissena polymorpha]|uniref:Uncharacterized protein n=1 Tax=Dreissena polymorpha TaxID=45954 RepID=A0A9D4CPZ6_DREPO|nr:hypothetical protein DPMN_054499 [Dreissena polymorpha]KAH3861424.1 hypothetical protein DPMN_024352 [Dreissena polymorpha]